MGLPVGGWKLPAGAEVWPAVLELIAGPGQPLDAVIEGDRTRDLLPNGRRPLKPQPIGQIGPDEARQIHEHVPFGPRFADAAPRNLGAENDAALPARLRHTTPSLLPRPPRQH